ncbi:peptidase A4 family-domain-containing protein [Annulohypoxylon truncatum]|uniref:peptidase A4 family-domain-containing protein n=1 Tax=Annulohypoxylon truncatum TaxID=327061 RepID=UPI002008D504|nr:peptidase A4 family-domain-containing protein [Annulohypoxylon truncatum]KAI1204125.1 peptidase A4 family-domain-containing protein [Annulohypoxylon truncatum]
MQIPIIASALLCANMVLAAPGTAMRRQRAADRIAERRLGRSSNTIQRVDSELGVTTKNGTSHVEYSSNWAGAVLIGSGYKTVTGTFVVPTPKAPSGGSSSTTYSASAWVGIDGDTCETAILQTGVDFTVQGSSVSYDAWYEWYPDYAYDFSGIPISAGDTITVTVTASSKSAGTAVVENVTTGKSVTHSFSGESDALCQTNAEWIVEDFESGGSLVSFADFGSIEFTGASVNGGTGTSGATIIDIEQSGKVLTDCSASGSTVSCSYSG